ncbi:MAG: alpha/beta fold hydrolase [Alphaproteobacteria bacterium]|nr:alpha/beta fold hydrolase [Alphaproteobacteria bacterium]
MTWRRWAGTLVAALGMVLVATGAALGQSAAGLPARDVGIVFLHGKLAPPPGAEFPLAAALKQAGYRVVMPEMPWSRPRGFDRTVEESMKEIDTHVAALRAAGAKAIVVGGHSLGAAATLRYIATRGGLAGAMLIAPGFSPEARGFQSLVGEALAQARRDVRAGRGGQRGRYIDIGDGGTTRPLEAPAAVYVDWYAPESAIVMPRNAAQVPAGLPIFYVLTSGDGRLYVGQGKSYVFDRLPPHPLNQWHSIASEHVRAPTTASGAVLAWLETLRKAR